MDNLMLGIVLGWGMHGFILIMIWIWFGIREANRKPKPWPIKEIYDAYVTEKDKTLFTKFPGYTRMPPDVTKEYLEFIDHQQKKYGTSEPELPM